MILFPNAKINIGLRILSKREDGYHNLESIFYPISLCDILEIVKANKFCFHQSGITLDIDAKDNIIIKAYSLIQERYKIGPVAIHLHKVIPTGAGLGGGSSDAVFALKLLNELFELNLSEKELFDLTLELGSDCPFFIKNLPSYVTGRGENIELVDFSLKNYWLKLVHPGIHSSTAEAFAKINSKNLINNDLKENIVFFKSDNKHILNDFESSVFGRFPLLQEIKNQLIADGAFYASMSGSGTSVYGIFEEKPSAWKSTYFEFIEQF